MDSIDMFEVERRARWAYERGRAVRAFLGFLPVLAIVATAAWLNARTTMVAALGSILFLVGFVLLWYGRNLSQAVLPGVLAGLIPLGLALCANHIGHVCTGSECVSMCIPACTVGGALAGLVVAHFAAKRQRSLGFWVLASGVAVLTGAMGCSCVGFSGVAGLGIGYIIALTPALLRRIRST
jgi:hypothetical protein